MMNSLEKNLRPTPRTLDEAQRNANYASSIYVFKSDAQNSWEFIVGAVYGFVMVGLAISAIALILYWLIGDKL